MRLSIKPGDIAIRDFGGSEMRLKVTEVTDDLIICGPWTFDRKTGAEVDDELEWGPQYGRSGSFLVGIEHSRGEA